MIYLLFFIGFVLLLKGASFLVDGASSLAKLLKVSDLVIGLTVVAFGTSTPELIVNLLASYQGNTEIAIGNILGSNISNILLILGISAVISPLVVHKNTLWKEIPFSLFAGIVLGILANDRLIDGLEGSILTRVDGLILLSFFVIFLIYTFGIARDGLQKQDGVEVVPLWRCCLSIVLGLVALILGGKWIVDGVVYISSSLGISQSFIALTVVAVGTSLPELATSAVAAYKKNLAISIGNIVGSNIFNIFFVLGASALIRPLPFRESSNIDLLVVVLASVLFFLAAFTGKRGLLRRSIHKIERWEGVLFLILYSGYIVYLVVRE